MMVKVCGWISLLLVPLSGIAQSTSSQPAPAPPLLIMADLPSYPAIAKAAHITGWLRMRIVVAKGKIEKVDVLATEARDDRSHVFSNGSRLLTEPTLEKLKSWRFQQSADKTLVVTYTYNISGTETDETTNPKVETLPSLNVTVNARPVSQTIKY